MSLTTQQEKNTYQGYSYWNELPVDLMQQVNDLPNELADEVKRELVKTAGQEFLNSVESATKLREQISGLTEYLAIPYICSLYGIRVWTGKHHFLDDFLIDAMGPGYCYLKCLDIDERFNALKMFYVWPCLQSVFTHFEQHFISKFYLLSHGDLNETPLTHMSPTPPSDCNTNFVIFHNQCNTCHVVSKAKFWSKNPDLPHSDNCTRDPEHILSTPDIEVVLDLKVGGFFDRLRSSSSSAPPRQSKTRRITDSTSHEDKQVLKFAKSIKGDGIEPDMSRDLYSVPKPTEIETMADHLSNHRAGDIFPYISVVGNEEETKDGRLSRLRAFRSSYGKENRPEMRINGVILDEIEGTIKVSHIGDYVNKERLSKQQKSENKKFKPLNEVSFKKPYLQIARITGEYVPLMSSTSDYTELYFTLEDGRLLDNQTIVQSNKLPTNQNGVFELSCDYCINLKDIDQLSLKYFLSRPIMKEGFQWGSVSLTIRVSESDTPYLTPKVEAMAIARIPFTTLEDQSKDPDHADVVYTAKQVEKFKELYRAGDVMDIDEAKRERTRLSSYSKSTIRGVAKGDAGPSHLAQQDGWEHLKGMVKPRMEEGVASISAASDPDEDDIDVPVTTREQYEKQQELLRAQFQSPMSDTTEEIPRSEMHRSSSSVSESNYMNIGEVTPPRPLKSAIKKPRFDDDNLKEPNVDNVYRFD